MQSLIAPGGSDAMNSAAPDARPPTHVAASRQRLLAVALPLSAGLLCLGSALTPKGLDQLILSTATAFKVLPIAAAHTGRLYLSNAMLLFGLGALGVSFLAIATLVRGRGATIATTAAVLGGIGCFSGALGNVSAGFNVAAAVSPGVPRQAAAAFLVATFTSAVGRLLFVVYLTGMLVGAVVAGVALWRSRRVPKWLAVLFPCGLAAATFAPVGIVALPIQLPFAVAMLVLGIHVWRDAAVAR
jgi:hypothetical protein